MPNPLYKRSWEALMGLLPFNLEMGVRAERAENEPALPAEPAELAEPTPAAPSAPALSAGFVRSQMEAILNAGGRISTQRANGVPLNPFFSPIGQSSGIDWEVPSNPESPVESARRIRMTAGEPGQWRIEFQTDAVTGNSVARPENPESRIVPMDAVMNMRDAMRLSDLVRDADAADTANAANAANDAANEEVNVGGVVPRDERVKTSVIESAKRLADLIVNAQFHYFANEVRQKIITAEMIGLAAGIAGLLGGAVAGDSKMGRTFAADLVVGGLYVAKGWSVGEFEWTFMGMLPGDGARMTIRRKDHDLSVELLGDHGLAPYDATGKGDFWHPTNWTEGTGVSEGTGKRIAEAVARDSMDLELPEDDDELC